LAYTLQKLLAQCHPAALPPPSVQFLPQNAAAPETLAAGLYRDPLGGGSLQSATKTSSWV